jgi:hypothetical protein
MKLPWSRPNPDLALGEDLAGHVRKMIASKAEPKLIASALADAPVGAARVALKVLLQRPDGLFTEDWWYKPSAGLTSNRKLEEAFADPGVARLAAEALIQLRRTKSQWRFDMAAHTLGHFLVTAVERVPDSEIPDVTRSILMVVEDLNLVKNQRMGNLVLPPPPPPRFLIEVIGLMQRRNRDIAWSLVKAMGQGNSNLAMVLRRMGGAGTASAAMLEEADSVLRLVELAGAVKGPVPTDSWLKRWREVQKNGGQNLRQALVELANNGETGEGLGWGGSGTDIPKAAVLALSSWSDQGTREFLRRTVLNWARSGAGSPSIGSAAVWSLASYGDREAMISMLDIRRRIRHKNLLKRLDQEIERLSKQVGMTPDEIADESVDDCGLGSGSSRSWPLGGHTVTLALGSNGEVAREVVAANGRPVKDVPATVRSEESAGWAEITGARKQLDANLSTQKARLEEAMITGRTWSPDRWERVFVGHPIMGNLARRVVWEDSTSGRLAMPGADGFAEPEMRAKGAAIRVVHPVNMSAEDQSRWQHEVVTRHLVQPFKQVFRETYFVTPAEVSECDRSHRFSGHVIPNQVMYALAKGRGWSGTMGLTGFDGSGQGIREFKSWNTRAFIEQDWAGNDDFATISEIYFVLQDSPGGPWHRADLAAVPRIPFSEAMRDVDLVVAVASIGTDQQWLDWEARRVAGTASWNDQRRAYASLAAAASSVRGRMIEEMIPLFGASDRVGVEGHFVHVKGKIGEYRIHLGSGNIHAEPSGRYLCIVPARGKDKVWSQQSVYLPFEDPDLKSAEVVSKILLLLNDDEVTDPVITAQLKRIGD